MVSGWFNSPRRLIVSFVLLLLIPAIAVACLGVQLIEQDRQLAARQLRERREIAAERIVAELGRAVAGAERRLTGDGLPDITFVSGDDAVVVSIHGFEIEVRPKDVLLYRPLRHQFADSEEQFSRGEVLEWRSRDTDAAIREYRALALRAKAPSVRAGALVRLARVLKNAGRHTAAMQAYMELEKLSSAYTAGVPADLAARRARAALLQELHRDDELRAVADSLRSDLLAARWIIDRGTFESYRQQTDMWLGYAVDVPKYRETLSASVEWLFNEYQRDSLTSSGRRSVRLRDTDVAILWHSDGNRLNALVAGPRFIEREWLGPARSRVERGPIDVTLAVPDAETPHASSGGSATLVRRSAAETGLPWTVVVKDAQSGPESAGLATQARMMTAGVGLLLLTVITGGYLIARAIGLELAVARLQSDFVAAVSHEFRTPLTTLRQFTSLLLEDDELAPAKRRSFYHAQARATDRLTNLVESLLDFGRMEAGAHPYRMEQVNVERLVSDVVEDFRREPAAEGFSLECVLDSSAALVTGDRDAINRAIRNLLENAVKYSDTDRRIDVQVTREEMVVAVSVRDRGFGVGREEQREIFNKFVRGSASRRRGIKGTGIGLAMVRHIIAAHGGRVTLQSELGRGSTFTIWLPVVHPHPSTTVVATSSAGD